MKPLHVFIGYDSTEHEAYKVAEYTLLKYATIPIVVHPLEHMDLRKKGLFWREWEVTKEGQTMCKVDGKPFSTGFSHSRFLVPELWRNLPKHDKLDLVMFVDCDWLFRADIGPLIKDIMEKSFTRNHSHPVYCVQHDFKPTVKKKMHGVEQVKYNMKLWSAFMIWDMAHPDNEVLIPETVNDADGSWLHQFKWVSDPHRIGTIDESWHVIPNHSEKNVSNIHAIHFTEMGPWHKGGETVRYAEWWNSAYNDYLLSQIKDVQFDVQKIIDI